MPTPAPVSHPLFARAYARISPAMDRKGAAEHRGRLLAGLTGTVIEVGAGDGANFAHYPNTVAHVRAAEPEPYLRARAERQALHAPVLVHVVDDVAEQLHVPDASVDAAVLSLILCSVRDPRAVLAEVARVLRPGGSLRFYEHVVAERPGLLRRVQQMADATVWPRLLGGCHTGRDTLASMVAAGFVIEELDRFSFPQISPASPHLLGRATLPRD